jgi:hypothetical protein
MLAFHHFDWGWGHKVQSAPATYRELTYLLFNSPKQERQSLAGLCWQAPGRGAPVPKALSPEPLLGLPGCQQHCFHSQMPWEMPSLTGYRFSSGGDMAIVSTHQDVQRAVPGVARACVFGKRGTNMHFGSFCCCETAWGRRKTSNSPTSPLPRADFNNSFPPTQVKHTLFFFDLLASAEFMF